MRKFKPVDSKPRYWEEETPIEAHLKFGSIRYFPNAQKIGFAYPEWKDRYGQMRPGKLIMLHTDDIRSSPEAMKILRALCAD